MLINYNVDMSYFTTINGFKLKSITIGPFEQDVFLTHQFSAITRKKLNFLNSKIKKELKDDGWYYLIEVKSDETINYDLKLSIKGKNISFYSWFNLWYATFEIISKYVIKNNYFEDGQSKLCADATNNINNVLAEVKTEEPTKSDDFSLRNSIMNMTLNKMKSKHKYGQKRKSAIQTLKNNKDLNNICDGIDDLAKGKKVELLDRNNLVFTIKRKYLDKLKTKNKDEFKVTYIYQLLK